MDLFDFFCYTCSMALQIQSLSTILVFYLNIHILIEEDELDPNMGLFFI